MIRRKNIILITILLLSFVLTSVFAYTKNKSNIPQKPSMNISDKEHVLIISPHPDDECLAAAGVIVKSLSKNDKIKVVMMTCGDSSLKAAQLYTKKNNPSPEDFKNLGLARAKETGQALAQLGLGQENIRFLGYPDGGLIYLWRRHWDFEHPRISGGVQVYRVPYSFAVKEGAFYCGQSVVDALTKEIYDFKPTKIYYPTTYDEHPDHWATGAFIKYVLSLNDYQNIVQYSYLIHRSLWPLPFMEDPHKPLLPPGDLSGLEKWVSLKLTDMEIRKKSQALKLYQTQQEVAEPFLDAFVRKNELFAVEGKKTIKRVKDVNSASSQDWGEIKELQAGTISRIIKSPADISVVKIAVDENAIRLLLTTRNGISPKVNYFIDSRFFYDDKHPKHLELKIKRLMVSIPQSSKSSINGKILNQSINNNTMDITFKCDDLKGAKKVMVSSYTETKKVRDRTHLGLFKILN